jgi:A/G-specific adenine glycosylase
MLQQTQIKTALPYFERWMSALPDFAALASASGARVLRLWEGLGYYSRARNLHRLAKAIADLPAPPRTPEAWRELPGVGPYTAAAIASLAFGAPAACVDGNVVRVLARLTADATRFRDRSAAVKHFTPLAGALLAHADPGVHNQAMMELGALVCRPRDPQCRFCPVRRFCAAACGEPEAYPRLDRKKSGQRTVIRVWCEQGDRLLLHRADAGARRLADLHELPTPADLGLDKAVVRGGQLLARKTRGIANHRIVELIYAVRLTAAQRRRLVENAALHWVPRSGLDRIALSGPHRRWVGELLQRNPAAACRRTQDFAIAVLADLALPMATSSADSGQRGFKPQS